MLNGKRQLHIKEPDDQRTERLISAGQSFWVKSADITEVAETMTATARKPIKPLNYYKDPPANPSALM